MHDRPANQAAGLLEFSNPPAPKLMAVVSHGEEQSELALLWRLCSSLTSFGYEVTVLDATSTESESNPGLEQILEFSCWPGSDDLDAPAWSVIPARVGLQTLCEFPAHTEQRLTHLGGIFPHEGIIILYGRAELLTPLLFRSGIKPLLSVAPLKQSLITSYQALKRLLRNGGIEPTVVNLVQEKPRTTASQVACMVGNLSDCARNFLGFELNALNIASPQDDNHPCVDIQRLALRMLESALSLTPAIPALVSRHHDHPTGKDYFVRSH